MSATPLPLPKLPSDHETRKLLDLLSEAMFLVKGDPPSLEDEPNGVDQASDYMERQIVRARQMKDMETATEYRVMLQGLKAMRMALGRFPLEGRER